ncbi:LAMI_0G01288g1_1 [Lachancea mirantina]|uniref:N-acetylglucosaminylphosphatidylinositol deacetylase n=1 Tax=Lachancea mirantina TaxID=1230905 RepID=A0A1G4K7G7_9SACH|nr:LAMI_0G01288g1_1 [Lachancea mirantina]
MLCLTINLQERQPPGKGTMKIVSRLIMAFAALWLVYLCSSSRITSRNASLFKAQFGNLQMSSFNLVIAHPDDEVMFFAPTLLQIDRYLDQDIQLRVICLTSGNAEGLGPVRSAELKRSVHILLPDRSVHVTVADLEDSMQVNWDIEDASQIIANQITDNAPVIVTFDSIGVSGHVNHISCFDAVNRFAKTHKPVATYALKSQKSRLLKFTGLVRPILSAWLRRENQEYFSTYPQYIHSLAAMISGHESQMAWFRYGWWILSQFVFSNQVVPSVAKVINVVD